MVDLVPRTVRVQGEIDISTTGELVDAIAPLLTDAPDEPMVFDVSGVTFMDSSGLAVLLDATARGHHVVVRGASPLIRRVIEATGLTGVISVEP
jgi:anti-anti-sigma factor